MYEVYPTQENEADARIIKQKMSKKYGEDELKY